MPEAVCNSCGGTLHWIWEYSFLIHGFAGGATERETATVSRLLREHGYEVVYDFWCPHVDIIESIKKNGVEQIPKNADVGYDDPRHYLPAAIVALLDEKLPLADGVGL